MAGNAKRPHTGEVTGHGTTGWAEAGGPFVILTGRITGPHDTGRPIRLKMTAGEARERAAGLIAMAEHIELVNGPKHAPAPEAEPEPAKPKGRLAEMLGMAAPIEFTEERPGVWKTATPEDGERLDASIDEALASLGTSLAELRAAEKQDETPTVCAACDRTRPRWTMASSITDGKESFVCSPKFAMHCGVCCKPGESLTHYTEEEHRHGDALLDHADAERAARLEASLDPTDGGE